MPWISLIVNFLGNIVAPLLSYLEKRRERKERLLELKAKDKEAKRHADTPVTDADAAKRLRKRAGAKRSKARRKS